MKKSLRLFAIVLLLAFLLPFGMPYAAADEEESTLPWNTRLTRVSGFADLIEPDTLKEEQALMKENLRAAEFDFPVMVTTTETMNGLAFGKYIDAVYENNELGYGENRDGIFLSINKDDETMIIRLYGRAVTIFNAEQLETLSGQIRDAYLSESYLGAVRAFRTGAFDIVQAAGMKSEEKTTYPEPDFETIPVSLQDGGSATKSKEKPAPDPKPSADTADTTTDTTTSTGQKLPDWYVTDPDSFVDFHNDENEPRLVDNADILTAEEEQRIAARLSEIKAATQQDIVIMTDTTSYGMDNETYEMDFYVYNGYGVGDTFDGLMLFINMDPDNREMVSTAFGKTREVFSQEQSSLLDDILYDHLTKQEYADAFLDWEDGVESLLTYGSVHFPKWYAAYLNGEELENGADEKVVTEVGGISKEERERLMETINTLRETYQTDVVVYVTERAYDLKDMGKTDISSKDIENYLDEYYAFRGYGVGEDKSGILLAIFSKESAANMVKMRTYGAIDERFTEEDREKIADTMLLNLSDCKYAGHVKRGLHFLSAFLKTGKVPHSWYIRIFWFILCLIAGYVSGAIGMQIKPKRRPDDVYEEEDADRYVVPGSFRILAAQDIYVSTTKSKHYIKKDSDSGSSYSSSGSSSSSSSGRSSYSSSSHSSSGRTGTTSRRKF